MKTKDLSFRQTTRRLSLGNVSWIWIINMVFLFHSISSPFVHLNFYVCKDIYKITGSAALSLRNMYFTAEQRTEFSWGHAQGGVASSRSGGGPSCRVRACSSEPGPVNNGVRGVGLWRGEWVVPLLKAVSGGRQGFHFVVNKQEKWQWKERADNWNVRRRTEHCFWVGICP